MQHGLGSSFQPEHIIATHLDTRSQDEQQQQQQHQHQHQHQPSSHQSPAAKVEAEYEPRLPSELLLIIIAIAASTSRQAALSLAFVSRSISEFTSALRWRTVALTTERQVLAFWEILIAYHENQEQEQDWTMDGHEKETAEKKAFDRTTIKFPNLSWDLNNSISLPGKGSVNPGSFVENLFVELEQDRFLYLSTRLQNQRERYAEALVDALNEIGEAKDKAARESNTQNNSLAEDIYSNRDLSPRKTSNHSWSQLQKIKLSPTRSQSRLSGLLYHLPNIQMISLGSVEFAALSRSLQSISPTEMTLVFDGDEVEFGQVLTWGSGTLPEEITWRRDARVNRPVPSLGGLRRNLKKLHVIGVDPRSQAPGLQMPYNLISPLRAGSLSRGSLIHAITQDWRSKKHEVQSELTNLINKRGERSFEIPESWIEEPEELAALDPPSELASRGITHLRYDTRKFSFRPAEIIVSRLRSFFQEVKPSNTSEEANEILESWGLGQFQRLHLSWDSENVDDIKKARFSSLSDSKSSEDGGWPREIKDTWTERSDRDLSPTFTHELSHTFQQLYGWQPLQSNIKSARNPESSSTVQGRSTASGNDIVARAKQVEPAIASFVADNLGELGKRLCGDGKEEETELLRSLEESVGIRLNSDLLRALGRNAGTEIKSFEDMRPDLRYGVRSPARLLRLGGKAALTREARLRLFDDRASDGPGAW